MNKDELQEFRQQLDRTGVVYLSFIPPGMAPHDIRAHLGAFGEIGKLHLVPLQKMKKDYDHDDDDDGDGDGGDDDVTKNRARKRKNIEKEMSSFHRKRINFAEGWVEFIDKRAAKTAVAALNGAPVMSNNPRQKGCLWCLKYLPGFKWVNLMEQLNLDRACREKRLRVGRSQARRENEHYLVQADKAQAQARAAKKKSESAQKPKEPSSSSSSNDFEELKIRFKQRKPIE